MRWAAALLCALLVILPSTFADCPKRNETSYSTRVANSYNKALDPMYHIKDLYLYQIYRGISFSTVTKYVNDGWPEPWVATEALIADFPAFAACIIVGLVFCILMLIFGLSCCCCRLCGHCGGKVDRMDPPSAKCKRLSCGFLLLLFVTAALGGVVEVFLSVDELHQQLQGGGEAVKNFNSSMVSTLQELNFTVEDVIGVPSKGLVAANGSINTILDETGEDMFVYLTSAPSVNLSISIGNGVEALESVENITRSLASELRILVVQEQNLTKELERLLQNLTRCCLNCSTPVPTKYSQLNDTILDGPMLAGAIAAIKQANYSYGNVTNVIYSCIDILKTESNSIISKAGSYLDDNAMTLRAELKPIVSSTLPSRGYPAAADYMDIGWYVGHGIGSLFSLIVLLIYTSLCCGLCGDRPGPYAPTCNKGKGANMLMAAVGLSFIFSWLLMLLTTGLFATSLAHLLCDAATNPGDVKSTAGSVSDIKIRAFGTTVTLGTIFNGLATCKDDGSLYDALRPIIPQFDEFVNNNSELINITSLTNKIETTSVTIPANIASVRDDLVSARISLQALEDLLLAITNLTSKPVVDPSLAMLIANVSGPQCDEVVKELEVLNSFVMLNMTTTLGHVTTNTQLALEPLHIANASLTLLLDSMEHLNTTVVNGSAIHIPQAIVNTAVNKTEVAVIKATTLVKSEMTGIPCCNLYNLALETADVACKDVLNPLDGFWFSLGWFLCLVVPIIACSLCLVGLYRREEPFVRNSKRNTEEPSYSEDEGINIRDSVPLDNMPARKVTSQQHPREAHNNTAYLADPYGGPLRRDEVAPPHYGVYYGSGQPAYGRASSGMPSARKYY